MNLPLELRSALTLGGLSPREAAVNTWKKIQSNEIMTRASACAFYAALASVPFLAVLLTIAVLVMPSPERDDPAGEDSAIEHTIQPLTSSLFPRDGSTQKLLNGLIEQQITRIQKEPPLTLLTIGLAFSLWTASSVFLAIIDALNRIHGVDESRPYWKLRLTAIGMTVVQAIILLGALLAIVLWPQVMGWLGLSGPGAALATVVRWVAIVVAVLLSFALTYYVAPDAEVEWEWITPGSLIGTFAFIGATLLFSLYVQNFGNYDKTYGSLGGVMVVLFWFWVTFLVLLSAAQFNMVIENSSPLGKDQGQKLDSSRLPDFGSIAPQPLNSGREE